jgi:hypothetical protein
MRSDFDTNEARVRRMINRKSMPDMRNWKMVPNINNLMSREEVTARMQSAHSMGVNAALKIIEQMRNYDKDLIVAVNGLLK